MSEIMSSEAIKALIKSRLEELVTDGMHIDAALAVTVEGPRVARATKKNRWRKRRAGQGRPRE
mgnify:CR=1 FL=1